MALFNTKKKTAAKKEAPKEKKEKKEKIMGMLSHVILRPRITEKSTDLVLKNAYVFDIDPRSNKVDVLRAIEEMYKVKPVRVNVVNLKQKKVVVRGRRGVKAGGKKAIVYLKKGDKIEFV